MPHDPDDDAPPDDDDTPPEEAATMGLEARTTPAAWTASLPSPVSVNQALALIKGALQEVDDAILDAKSRGTVPPPPWPVHAALKKAIDSMDGGRLQLEAATALGMGSKSAKKGEPRWEQLRKGGEQLYTELAVMDANLAKGVDLSAVAKTAAKLATFPLLGSLTGSTLIVVALVALWYFEGRGRGRAWG